MKQMSLFKILIAGLVPALSIVYVFAQMEVEPQKKVYEQQETEVPVQQALDDQDEQDVDFEQDDEDQSQPVQERQEIIYEYPDYYYPNGFRPGIYNRPGSWSMYYGRPYPAQWLRRSRTSPWQRNGGMRRGMSPGRVRAYGRHR